MIEWKQLRPNLVELASAKSDSDLIAFGNNRVFNKHYGWGKFLNFFSCGKQSPERVRTILQNIQKTAYKQLIHVWEQREIYFQQLGREIRGERFSIKDREKAEKELLQFCFYMKPLMRDVRRGKNAFYLNLIFGEKKDLLEEWKEVFSIINVFQRIKNVEITLKTPLPLISLMKAASSLPLKAREETEVDHWLTQLGSSLNLKIPSFKGLVNCTFAEVRFLHRFLRDIVSMFNELKSETSNKAVTGVIEAYIQNLNCPEFNLPDKKHQEWAKSLRPGAIVKDTKGQKYTIGRVLQWDRNYPKIPAALSLKGHPDLELVIDRNEAIGYLNNYTADLMQCGIIKAKDVAFEEKGRANIQERIPYLLSDIDWKNGYIEASKPIIELVRGFIALPFTPGPLTRATFGFNRQGEMRARHLLTIRDKSWDELEAFVLEIAHDSSGNFYRKAYDHIMEQSGLIRHIYRKFNN